MDKVFVKRLWRSVKYEDVYLRADETPAAVRIGLTPYFGFYNTQRRHQTLNRRTPDAVLWCRLQRSRRQYNDRQIFHLASCLKIVDHFKPRVMDTPSSTCRNAVAICPSNH
ncbi:MAG: transposase [Nitrospirales bacterium]|nr:transposase [Nitrospirales bacterium]